MPQVRARAGWPSIRAEGVVKDEDLLCSAEHRLLTVAGPSSASYVYGSIGQRVRQTIGSSSKDYVFDQAGRVITQMSPGWARSELYASGLHVATYTNNTTYFDHSDWLGTVRARSSVSGASVESCTSLPFGDAQTCTGTDWSPLHFTDQDWDSETSLTHFMFRQLSTTAGRWTVPDPAGIGAVNPGDPQTWNRYTYVGSNPLSAIDPLGLWRSDAFSSGLDGSCAINGFISACAMVMSFASAGGGGEFGFLCQGNCNAFNSGQLIIAADNQVYFHGEFDDPLSPSALEELSSSLTNGFFLFTKLSTGAANKGQYLSVTYDRCGATGRDIHYKLNGGKGYVWEVLTYSNGSVENKTQSATLNGYPDFISIWGTQSPISQRFVMSPRSPGPGAQGTALQIQHNENGWLFMTDSQIIQRTNDNIYVAGKACPK